MVAFKSKLLGVRPHLFPPCLPPTTLQHVLGIPQTLSRLKDRGLKEDNVFQVGGMIGIVMY